MDKSITYKDSPLGKIPSDWDVKTLGQIADVKGGKRIPKGESLTDENTGFPYIRVSDMFMGGVDSSRILFVPKHIEPLIRNYKIRKNELFITVAGTIGMVGEIPDELDNANLTENANKIIIREADRKYVLFYLMSDKTQGIIKGSTTNNAQPKLALERIREFFIPLPPLTEQKAIAHIFGLMDITINSNNSLIAKKELQKKWLIQNLLTGKKRVEGYSDEWKKEKLEKYLVKHEEKSTSNNQYPVLTSSRRGIFLQSDYYTRDVASENNTGYNVVPRGYFTYRHMSDDLVFKFNINDIVDRGIVSTLYPVFTVKNIDKYFLLSILNEGNEFKIHAQEQKQGGSRTYVYFKTLCELKLNLPTFEEQKAISNVLQIADKEIQILKAKSDKLQEQKKGLMQLLLTGKKRLKVN